MSSKIFSESKLPSMGSRLRSVRLYKGLSNNDFATILHISPGYLSEIENDKKAMSQHNITLLAEKFGIDLHWLLTGKGYMFKSIVASTLVGEEIATYRPERERIGNILLKNGAVNEEELQKALEEQSGLGRDPELDEIIGLLKYDLPELKKYILKILKARKEFRAGVKSLMEIDKAAIKEET